MDSMKHFSKLGISVKEAVESGGVIEALCSTQAVGKLQQMLGSSNVTITGVHNGSVVIHVNPDALQSAAAANVKPKREKAPEDRITSKMIYAVKRMDADTNTVDFAEVGDEGMYISINAKAFPIERATLEALELGDDLDDQEQLHYYVQFATEEDGEQIVTGRSVTRLIQRILTVKNRIV